jgi:hypothetical protein
VFDLNTFKDETLFKATMVALSAIICETFRSETFAVDRFNSVNFKVGTSIVAKVALSATRVVNLACVEFIKLVFVTEELRTEAFANPVFRPDVFNR